MFQYRSVLFLVPLPWILNGGLFTLCYYTQWNEYVYSPHMGISDWLLHLKGRQKLHIGALQLGKEFLNNFHRKLLEVWLNKTWRMKMPVLLGLAFEMCRSSLSHQQTHLDLYQNEDFFHSPVDFRAHSHTLLLTPAHCRTCWWTNMDRRMMKARTSSLAERRSFKSPVRLRQSPCMWEGSGPFGPYLTGNMPCSVHTYV